jgi:hypothetical protein
MERVRAWNNETPVLFHVEHWSRRCKHEPETFYNVLRGTESDLRLQLLRTGTLCCLG